MKNFEQDLLLLNSKLDRFEQMAGMFAEPEKMNKLEQLLENIELDDLIDAVKLYKDNLAFFMENTSMNQSSNSHLMSNQNMAFGRHQTPRQESPGPYANKARAQVQETEPVDQITEEEEESSMAANVPVPAPQKMRGSNGDRNKMLQSSSTPNKMRHSSNKSELERSRPSANIPRPVEQMEMKGDDGDDVFFSEYSSARQRARAKKANKRNK